MKKTKLRLALSHSQKTFWCTDHFSRFWVLNEVRNHVDFLGYSNNTKVPNNLSMQPAKHLPTVRCIMLRCIAVFCIICSNTHYVLHWHIVLELHVKYIHTNAAVLIPDESFTACYLVGRTCTVRLILWVVNCLISCTCIVAVIHQQNGIKLVQWDGRNYFNNCKINYISLDFN